MNYIKFKNEIRCRLHELLGDEFIVSFKAIRKNNNVVLDGLTIRKEEENISPTVYLNYYYEDYKAGKSIQEILFEIKSLYEENENNSRINVEFFSNFDCVRNRIVYKIIHYDKNKELLKNIPHFRYLDLAIVFYYLVQNDVLGNATILIYNSHLDIWKVSKEEIFNIAKANTQKILEYQISTIEDMLKEEIDEELLSEAREEDLPMYVLTNQSKINGAACILYPNLLKNFSNALKSNLYLLPSSIHEFILIPKSKEVNLQDLKEMVQDTNNHYVEDEEILSYSVYEYLRNEDKIKISI